jgi:methylated-DNA-protein-cysteine methyltransferase-like protein
MTEFTERVIQVIKSIPEGKVLSYGSIAGLAGSPRGARQVTRTLHTMSKKHNLPWHRVVNSKGKISLKDPLGYEEQKHLLESEGVVFSCDDRIDSKCFWDVDVTSPQKL